MFSDAPEAMSKVDALGTARPVPPTFLSRSALPVLLVAERAVNLRSTDWLPEELLRLSAGPPVVVMLPVPLVMVSAPVLLVPRTPPPPEFEPVKELKVIAPA